MASCNCKVATDLEPEQRAWVEQELARNRQYRQLRAEIQERFNVTIYERTLVDHKKKHMVNAEADSAFRTKVDAVRVKLEQEMQGASVLIQPLYLVALRNLDALEDTNPSQDALIKAVKALGDITGNASDRDALAAYAVRHAEQQRDAQAETA